MSLLILTVNQKSCVLNFLVLGLTHLETNSSPSVSEADVLST